MLFRFRSCGAQKKCYYKYCSHFAGGNAPDEVFRQLAMTLLQQSHLTPVPLEAKPVAWQHDQALALYPLPHLLVLADAGCALASTSFEDCECLNPVRFRYCCLCSSKTLGLRACDNVLRRLRVPELVACLNPVRLAYCARGVHVL